MGWDNQGGKGGGPWGGGGDNRGPWGNGSGNNRKNGATPPDLEEFIKQFQDKVRKLLPGGGGMGGITLVLLVIIGFWASSGVYRVNEGDQAVILQFGKWSRTVKDTGLHYHLPTPIESVIIRKVTEINRIDIGILFGNGQQNERQVFMLTGDENILDVNMTIFWFIKNLEEYLFRSADPALTVQIAAESAVREVISQTPMELALTKGKSEIVEKVHKRLQEILDLYKIGVQIEKVSLQKVDAPSPVIDAFRDVQSARADEERMVNEATGYRDSIIPVARGEASKVIQEAMAYKEQIVAKSTGDAARFMSVYTEYKAAPDVTKKRMFLETMSKILSTSNKVLVDSKSKGVLPYLPLSGLKNKEPEDKEEKSQKSENGEASK